MTFKNWLDEERSINEMPKYIDHDYIPFKPIEDRSMQVLESRFDELKVFIPPGVNGVPSDLKIYINKRKSMAFLGLTRFNEERGSWVLEVATWIKLESLNSHYKVIGVYTNEEITGKGYALVLYYSLYKNKMRLSSDNEQYQGAKPLWKALSRIIDIEVYDEKTKTVIHQKYDQTKIKDSEIWSPDDKHFLKILRTK